MATIYTNGQYKMYLLTADRFMLSHDGQTICKYDNTVEGISEMLEDLIYFLEEDGLVKNHAKKNLLEDLKKVLDNYKAQ